MAIARVQLPDGRIARLEVPEGTTQEQVMAFVDQQFTAQPTGGVQNGTTDSLGAPIPDTPSGEPVSTAAAIVEPLITLGSAAIAEPIAGLAGIAGALLPGEEGQGARFVEATREALTIQPGSESGRRGLEAAGEFLAPVGKLFGEAEKGLGDATFKATNSPALAAAAATIPTAITEFLGVAAGKSAIKAARGIQKRMRRGEIAREITDALPTIEQLKGAAREVFTEIDEAGAVVKPGAFEALAAKVTREAKKTGVDPVVTPKASRAVDRFNEVVGQPVTVSELDTLREVAQGAASALEPKERLLGVTIIETVDEFLDNAGPAVLTAPDPKTIAGIGKRYKVARDMWGRARRSELLGEAFEKARNQASGFENGVRTQFRSIINNKKQRRFFTKEELSAMTKVVRGDTKENIARLIGRFGFSEGGATNIIGGALGATAGGVAFGAPGAVIVPLVGQVSRKLAQRMTAKGAEFADQVIRAGKNAKKITAAYLDNTPKALRSSEELADLLTRGDIDLATLPGDALSTTAGQLAQQRRLELAGALTAGTTTGQEGNQ